jgi:hypothetical protein
VVFQGAWQSGETEDPRLEARCRLKPKCCFCDTELEVVVYTFKVGPRDEPVCEECHLKTVNRRNAKTEEEKGSGSG